MIYAQPLVEKSDFLVIIEHPRLLLYQTNAMEIAVSIICFVGLGNMGLPMAVNAAKAGHEVRGYDISPDRRKAAADAGLATFPEIEQASRDANVLITMLNTGPVVVEVWQRAVIGMAKGALLIDCSSINAESSVSAHEIAARYAMDSLDAPVSGGVEGAANATLTFMVGGTDAAFAKGLPLLRELGRRQVHCGPAGTGVVAKICNNMILGINMIAVSEAFILAEKLGLSAQALFDVAGQASGQCYALTTHCPVPGPVPTSAANFGYRPGFAAELMAKDLRLSQESASFAGASTPLGAAAFEMFTRFVDTTGRQKDYAAIITYLRTLSDRSDVEDKTV